jgi:L-ascorbate metabolism protein UlaG (beta-lactamase superfamily)
MVLWAGRESGGVTILLLLATLSPDSGSSRQPAQETGAPVMRQLGFRKATGARQGIRLGCCRVAAIFAWLIMPLVEPVASEPPGMTSTGVEVRFLANAGFLLRTAGTGVLVDAFLAKPYAAYGVIPDDVLREMLMGGAPFHEVRLALVSHRREDHFQADIAALFLQKRPKIQLVSTPQVIEALRSAAGRVPENAHALWPDAGATGVWDATPGVRVEFLRLPHGSSTHDDIQNLVSIVSLGGRRILHLGDATMQSSAYAPYADQLAAVDIALIPYWFFEDEDGRETIDTWLKDSLKIAMHLPVRDADAIIQRLQKSDPQVRVLDSAMQFLRY